MLSKADFSSRGKKRWRHRNRTHGKRYLYLGGKLCGVIWVKRESYACSKCGAAGVKLWRPYSSSHVELHCARCACTAQGKPYDQMDAAGTLLDGVDGVRRDQIGWLVPAVPDERPDAQHRFAGNWWGYTSVPDEDVAWWKTLPLELGA
jgi:hypothetical protein